MRPLTLLSGSLLLFGLTACSGEPPAVGYGPGKDEVAAHMAEQQRQKAAAEAKNLHGHGKHAHAVERPAARALPKLPSPDISYDSPFDGKPLRTQTDANGITIDDFVLGEGLEAVKGAAVVMHYTGYLTDGTVFDTSLKRGRPFPFALGAGRVIKGWDLGIVGMRVGGKRRLVIPAEFGYAARAAGKIPPNSTLIFTVELVSMTPPLPPPQPLSAYQGAALKTDKRSDGLIISDYNIGTGAEATEGHELRVHYQGTLKDGTEFDSSHKRGKPIAFVLGRGRVIKGWDLGIAGMKVGGLRKLVIPAELGYKERARGKIPANSELTFLVELMAVKAVKAPPLRPHVGAKAHGHPAAKPANPAAKPAARPNPAAKPAARPNPAAKPPAQGTAPIQ